MNEFEVRPPLRTKQTNLITLPTVIRFLYYSPKTATNLDNRGCERYSRTSRKGISEAALTIVAALFMRS